MNSWYVLHVITGKEDKICDVLNRDFPNCKAVIPKRKLRELKQGSWRMVTKTLFPGYIFINTFIDPAGYYALTELPSVIRILGDNNGPQSVSEEEMQLILRLSGGGDPSGISSAFLKGGKVIVTSGPLLGMEGRIIKIDARRFRARVNICILGQSRIVELGIHMIKKTGPAAC